MTRAISVEKIEFGLGLMALEAEWNELLERSSRPTIYSSFDYFYTSCVHFKRSEEIFCLLFRDVLQGELLAIYPMSVWYEKSSGVTLKSLRHGITTYTSDVDKPYPIISRDLESVCWKRFSDYFKKEYQAWDLIIYYELMSESFLISGLRKLFPFPAYRVKAIPGPASPMVRLDGDVDAFWRAHANTRRKSRRIEKIIGDGFSYRVLRDPADVEYCLNQYIAVEEMGYKAGQGVSRQESIPFYHDLLPRLAKRGQVLFGMMYDGDTVISAEISYTYLDRVYFALGTYNPAYAHLSPGTVSTARSIAYFHGKGFVEGDFLAGFAHYINPWAYRLDKTHDVTIRRMGWKNLYLAALYVGRKIKNKIKTFLCKCPHRMVDRKTK